jgi:capsular polysaccharide biosynthesis protein/Mrp family chromosome partitioning ATPase
MDNKSLLPLLKRWWRLLIVGAVVGGFAGHYVASNSAPTYEAVVKMLVGPINTDYDTLRAAGELGRSYAELATSKPVLAYGIRKAQARTTPTALIDKGAIKTTSNDITRIVQISVDYGDAATAANLANALAGRIQRLASATPKAATTSTSALMTQPEIRALPTGTQDAISTAVRRVLNPSIGGMVTVVDPAERPVTPVAPRVTLITIMAAFMGLLGMCVIVLLRESSAKGLADERLLTTLDEPAFLGALVAPRTRKGGGQLAVEVGASAAIDGYRAVATKLGFFDDRPPVRTLLVIDPHKGKRSGVAAANLAGVLADARRRVVLLDAGSMEGGATTALALEGQPGFSELLAGAGLESLDGQVAQVRVPRAPGFDVLPRGVAPGSNVLDVEGAQRLLEYLEADVDFVIVSASPIHRSPAALVWARVADGTILVVDDKRTTEEELTDVVRSLRFVGARLLGTVLGRGGRFRGKGPRRPAEPATSSAPPPKIGAPTP